METHMRPLKFIENACATFTLDQYRLRVEPAMAENRAESLGEFNVDGTCYVVLSDRHDRMAAPMLTRREREIALQIANGRGTKQIAYDLGISPHTAMTYVNRIRTKLGVRNRPEMIAALLGA